MSIARGGKGAGLALTWAKTRARNDGLGLFGLETDVELETVDVAVQLLRRGRNGWVGVPLNETRVGCDIAKGQINGLVCKPQTRTPQA